MEVAIFGGSFNPPTRAHQAIIDACLQRSDIDEVWTMPSGERFDKSYDTTDADRLAMLRLVKDEVFSGDNRLVITDFELQLPRPTQTWRTVEALQRLHPKHRFWFVYGVDAYHAMPSWQKGCELQTTLSMLMIARNGIQVPDAPHIKPLQVAAAGDISSSLAREYVASGRKLEGLVCDAVAGYIREKRLYGSRSSLPVQC